MKTKIILGISIFIVLGLIIGLSVYFTLPKKSNSTLYENRNLIGDKVCDTKFFFLHETDFQGYKTDITSNTIRVNITPTIVNYAKRMPCQIQIGKGCKCAVLINPDTIAANERNNDIFIYNITKIDAKNNTITFNAPENFQLSSAEAWPIGISFCEEGKPPEII